MFLKCHSLPPHSYLCIYGHLSVSLELPIKNLLFSVSLQQTETITKITHPIKIQSTRCHVVLSPTATFTTQLRLGELVREEETERL